MRPKRCGQCNTHCVLDQAMRPPGSRSSSVRDPATIAKPGSFEQPHRKQCNAKIDPKLVPGGYVGHPKRTKIGPGTCSGRPVAAKSGPKAPRGRRGSVSERPWCLRGTSGERSESLRGRTRTPKRASWSARERAETAKIDAKSRPGSKNARVFTQCSFTNHRQGDFSAKSVDCRHCCDVCEPSEVPRLPAKTKVRHIVLHVELLA